MFCLSKETISTIIIGLLFLAPPTILGNVIMIFCVLFIYMMNKPQIPNSSIIVLILIGLFLSFSVNYFLLSPVECSKSIVRTISLGLLFLLFPYFNSDIKIKEWLPFVLLLIILLSQLADVLSLGPLLKIINYIYPEYDQFHVYGASGVDFSLGMSGRYGGIYRNPNNCGRSILLVTILYLVITHTKNVSKIKDYSILLLSLVGVLTTGSRTNAIIYVIMIVSCVYLRNDSLSKSWKNVIVIISCLVGFYLFEKIVGTESRLISTNFEINDRQNLFYALMESLVSNIPHLLLGYFFQESLQTLHLGFSGGFDGDLANIIYYYGFLNLILLVGFVYSIFKKSGPIFMYILPVFLTMVSNGLFSSFQASFHIMIVLSICLSYSRKCTT